MKSDRACEQRQPEEKEGKRMQTRRFSPLSSLLRLRVTLEYAFVHSREGRVRDRTPRLASKKGSERERQPRPRMRVHPLAYVRTPVQIRVCTRNRGGGALGAPPRVPPPPRPAAPLRKGGFLSLGPSRTRLFLSHGLSLSLSLSLTLSLSLSLFLSRAHVSRALSLPPPLADLTLSRKRPIRLLPTIRSLRLRRTRYVPIRSSCLSQPREICST
jgi:hypothetical protein